MFIPLKLTVFDRFGKVPSPMIQPKLNWLNCLAHGGKKRSYHCESRSTGWHDLAPQNAWGFFSSFRHHLGHIHGISPSRSHPSHPYMPSNHPPCSINRGHGHQLAGQLLANCMGSNPTVILTMSWIHMDTLYGYLWILMAIWRIIEVICANIGILSSIIQYYSIVDISK